MLLSAIECYIFSWLPCNKLLIVIVFCCIFEYFNVKQSSSCFYNDKNRPWANNDQIKYWKQYDFAINYCLGICEEGTCEIFYSPLWFYLFMNHLGCQCVYLLWSFLTGLRRFHSFHWTNQTVNFIAFVCVCGNEWNCINVNSISIVFSKAV